MNKCSLWTRTWQMEYSAEKCEVIYFGANIRKITECVNR